MDIYTLLKKDHNKVSNLIDDAISTHNSSRRVMIFDEIYKELTLHAETEEATFYAALDAAKETQEKIDNAQEDQDEIKDFLRRLSSMTASNEKWMEVFGEFKQAVEHHVKDEEERIFPIAKEVLSERQAIELGEKMERLKKSFIQAAA